MKCENCRFWSKPEPYLEPFGECKKAKSHGNKPIYGDTLAFSEDADDYKAWLRTKADFGCVMFEILERS